MSVRLLPLPLLTLRRASQGVDEAAVLERPIIYVHFAEGIGENKYLPLDTWEALNKLLQDALAQYNDMVASMNLVLFEDAMDHICRYVRLLGTRRLPAWQQSDANTANPLAS